MASSKPEQPPTPQRQYRPYKFLIQPVVQIVGDDGEVVGEAETNHATLFGVEAALEWIEGFPAALNAAAATVAPTVGGAATNGRG